MRSISRLQKIVVVCLLFLGLRFAPGVQALEYKNGVYTNLCGSGTQATQNTCDRGCNTERGTCSTSEKFVVKYTCEGRLTECNQKETGFAKSQSLGNPGCGKTVQINVFNKTCRNRGQWSCNQENLQDYMVWYSGDCPAGGTGGRGILDRFFPRRNSSPTPTPAPTPTPIVSVTPTPGTHHSSCESLAVVGGNDNLVPATVTLRARGQDNQGPIQRYHFYFGDGTQVESTNPEVQHRYEVSGKFKARVDVKDSQGNWQTGLACETQVRVKPSSVESAKSGCSDLKISASNNAKPPSTVTVEVNGFDNKGDLKEYRVDFGNGITKDGPTSTFENVYDRAGTYTVRGYVKDSQGNWVGGVNDCKRTLYINSEPLTQQPATGTPTVLSLLGLGSGVGGTALHFFKRRLSKTPVS
jgi:hypothetical protein